MIYIYTETQKKMEDTQQNINTSYKQHDPASTLSSSSTIPSMYIVLISLDITMLFVSVILNLLGVYLLVQLRRPKNIHLVLTHLSVVEMTVQAIRFVSAIYFFWYDDHEEHLGYQVTRTLTVQGLCVTYVLVMVVVALDPLLIVTLKLKYQHEVTKRKTNAVLAACWSVGVVCGTGSFMFAYKTRELISIKYTFPITTSLFLVFSLASYATIYRHVRFNNNKSIKGTIRSVSSSSVPRPALRFRVPVLITSTFFLFCLTPSFIQVALGDTGRLTKDVFLAIGICFSLGFVLDSLVYMLLHPMVKKVLLRLLQSRGLIHSRNSKSISTTTNMARAGSFPHLDQTKL